MLKFFACPSVAASQSSHELRIVGIIANDRHTDRFLEGQPGPKEGLENRHGKASAVARVFATMTTAPCLPFEWEYF